MKGQNQINWKKAAGLALVAALTLGAAGLILGRQQKNETAPAEVDQDPFKGKLLELHLHLDGSLRPETVWELAQEQGVDLPADSVEELRPLLQVPADCTSLEDYLKCFDLPLQVLQDEASLERVAFELVEDLAKEGLSYAEIRFAPQLSLQKGLTQDQVTEAAIRGVKRGMEQYPEIRAGLILCCMRGNGNEALNMDTVETARKYLGDVVCALDIAGAEGLFPTEQFRPVFEKAMEYNLPITIHAGEAAGPESMWAALSMGANRIGHGIAAAEDPKLMEELKHRGVALEVCPTSNVNTQAVSSLEEHPIRTLFDAGVKVTLSSDNRTVSSTNLHREIELLETRLGFTQEEIVQILQNGWDVRFLKGS